jgi:glycosyltransferase involved in cell wall biosynthesis
MFNMSAYSAWQSGVQNRNFHILNQLLVDERVERILAIDYLPHIYKRLARVFVDDILKPPPGEILDKSLLSRLVRVNDKLTVYSSAVAKLSLKKFYRDLTEILKELGFDDYLLWSYYPLEIGYFKELQPRLKIFDAVDNWIEHPSYKKFKDRLASNYQIIDQEADLIFTVAEEQQALFTRQEKVHWIPNGVDLKHYQREYGIINRDIGDLPKPIIGYVGTIQDRVDLDLLEYLVKSNPEKSFVLVGPVWYSSIQEKFAAYHNIYFLGRKSYQEVPMYIQQFDVGIIPHRLDNFLKSTNPMKVYEYLACGKPVVSTGGSGINLFKDVVYIADEYKKFNQFVNQALTEDDKYLAHERVVAVKDHSWLKRTERMLSLIYKKL